MLRANIVAEAAINQERDGYKVTEDMIKNFYEANKSRYEQAKVKIIYLPLLSPIRALCTASRGVRQASGLARPRTPANLRSEEAAKKLARDILGQLKVRRDVRGDGR